MKVWFAVEKDDGIQSSVHGHFGSAPAFIVVDAEINKAVTLNNRDLNHMHGACNPIRAIGGLKPDAMVAGGIDAGAITRLNAEGVKVYRAAAETIRGGCGHQY